MRVMELDLPADLRLGWPLRVSGTRQDPPSWKDQRDGRRSANDQDQESDQEPKTEGSCPQCHEISLPWDVAVATTERADTTAESEELPIRGHSAGNASSGRVIALPPRTLRIIERNAAVHLKVSGTHAPTSDSELRYSCRGPHTR
jgi:hypothetical protein